ncbi:HvfC/BufC family peptide modification chaperone [Taklimakanibacter deserti]|uniref:HvfC/BufC family peptide modification chaperone n=1 Tax=Taklimakanibacter deserti TaxID=2267839 RepID=UPI000E64D50B
MRDLAELQVSMTRALIDGSFSDIEGEFTAGHADPARRYAIYRNNMFLSLIAHLRTIFPVTAKLGDERFFAYAAHQFILRGPPRESRLVVYGSAFPQFLSRFPACRHAPILAQMAALEWAIHRALTSAQLPFLDFADLAHASTLDLQPSLGFVVSRWPVLGLWAHQSERRQALPRRISRIALLRHDDDIRFFELNTARFAFWRGLSRRLTIEEAAARALARDPHFNLTDEIVFLFRNRLATGVDAAEPQKG